MKKLFGFVGLVLIWPGAFTLLGVVSHIFMGAGYYGYPFEYVELVVPSALLIIGCAVRQSTSQDGFERTADAIASLAKFCAGLALILTLIAVFSSGFTNFGYWYMVPVSLVIAAVASWARLIACLHIPDSEPEIPGTYDKISDLSKDYLTEFWCTWNGEKFVNTDGTISVSRAFQGKQLLKFLIEQSDSSYQLTDAPKADLHAPDHWGNLDALEHGDEIWLYTRHSWSGRALVRDGNILAYTEDSHLNYQQPPAPSGNTVKPVSQDIPSRSRSSS